MCGRAGWYGAGRRQETCEDKFPAAAWTDVVKNMGDDVTGHLRRVFFFIFTTSTYLPAVRYYSLTASAYHFRLYRLTYNRPSGRYVGNMRMPTSDLHAVRCTRLGMHTRT